MLKHKPCHVQGREKRQERKKKLYPLKLHLRSHTQLRDTQADAEHHVSSPAASEGALEYIYLACMIAAWGQFPDSQLLPSHIAAPIPPSAVRL